MRHTKAESQLQVAVFKNVIDDVFGTAWLVCDILYVDGEDIGVNGYQLLPGNGEVKEQTGNSKVV